MTVTEPADGAARYRLLETVAAYGQERLDEAGEADEVAARHAEHYTALAEQAGERLRGHEQRHWLRVLDAESGNLRAALATAVRQRDATLALRLVESMAWYWFVRGKHQEGHRAVTAALDLPGPASERARAEAGIWQVMLGFLRGTVPDPIVDGQPTLRRLAELDEPAALARARWRIAFVGRSGVPAGTRSLIDAALPVFRELDDRWSLGAALITRADHALRAGELTAATRDGDAAAAVFAELGERWGQVQAALVLGMLAEIAEDYDRSARLHHDGLRMAEEFGLWPAAAHHRGRLGRLALLAGDYRAADEQHRQAMELAAEHSYESCVSFARMGLALSARRQGRFDEAEEQLNLVLAWEQRIGFRTGIALTMAELGFLAEQRGDARTAYRLHREGQHAARSTGDLRSIALAMEGMAGALAIGAGLHPIERETAARLLGVATAAREFSGYPLATAERGDVDRITSALRAALGDVDFHREFEHGKEFFRRVKAPDRSTR